MKKKREFLKSLEEGLNSALFFDGMFDENEDDEETKEAYRARLEKIKREEIDLNDFNKFDFIERRVIVDEYLHHMNSQKPRRIIDLSFCTKEGEVYVEDGFINPVSPLALTDLAFSHRGNMIDRINKNVYGITDKYLNSFYEFCAYYNDSKLKDIELQTIGEKNEVFVNDKVPISFYWEPMHNKTGRGLFASVKAIFDYTSGYFGHTGPGQDKIVIAESQLRGTPELSERRKKKVLLKRIAMFNGAFLSNIQDILEAPFRTINGLYVGGIREVLSNTNDFEAFCGILENEQMLAQEDILSSINENLGKGGLGTAYEIRYSRGVTDKEIESLQNKLDKRGFAGNYLYKGLLEKGLVHRYELFDTITNTSVKRSEVGLGIIQVLPIIANMSAHKNSLLVIEQPELHLHPAQQSKLAQMVVKNHATNKNRFMIETHSEHFIKTIQLEIARSASNKNSPDGLTKEDVQILYVDRDEEKNGSYAREIELTEDGSFSEPWPDNFFEASADITLERLRITNRN